MGPGEQGEANRQPHRHTRGVLLKTKVITSIPNRYGAVGSPLAYSPAFNMNARVRPRVLGLRFDCDFRSGGKELAGDG
jgi:hypothetical protein